jgi:two-component system alkaline phosphatase synthesis response regulator PhoP
MDALLVFPDRPPLELVRALDDGGYPFKTVRSAQAAVDEEPDDGWSGAIVWAVDDPDAAYELCRTLRHRDPAPALEPLILIVAAGALADLEVRDDLFDEFIVDTQVALELAPRLRHRFWRTGRGTRPDLVEYGKLKLNPETYQAAIDGEPLNLTFMEYELLKFFATHPGKVFTREALLSRVWGYDYYGGARTVDVHVRRLRAKLGEEYASYISTVRSVGYRFGSARMQW